MLKLFQKENNNQNSKQTNHVDCWCNICEFGVQMVRKGTGLALTVSASAQAPETLGNINANNENRAEESFLISMHKEKQFCQSLTSTLASMTYFSLTVAICSARH